MLILSIERDKNNRQYGTKERNKMNIKELQTLANEKYQKEPEKMLEAFETLKRVDPEDKYGNRANYLGSQDIPTELPPNSVMGFEKGVEENSSLEDMSNIISHSFFSHIGAKAMHLYTDIVITRDEEGQLTAIATLK